MLLKDSNFLEGVKKNFGGRVVNLFNYLFFRVGGGGRGGGGLFLNGPAIKKITFFCGFAYIRTFCYLSFVIGLFWD